VTADLDLLKGTLDTLVLKTLSWGPRHGYAVARWIKDATDGTITVDWRLRNHVFTDLAGCHCSAFLLGGQQATPIGGAKTTLQLLRRTGRSANSRSRLSRRWRCCRCSTRRDPFVRTVGARIRPRSELLRESQSVFMRRATCVDPALVLRSDW